MRFFVSKVGGGQYDWTLINTAGAILAQAWKPFPTVAQAVADCKTLQAASQQIAGATIQSPQSPPPPPPPPPPPTATAPQSSDFTYLGSWIEKDSVAGGLTYGAGLTHRYVNGQLRLLTVALGNYTYDLVEFALPSDFATPITARTNEWPGSAVWINGLNGRHYGITWDEATGLLRSNDSIDYPQVLADGTNYRGLTSALSVRTLNDDGTVSNLRGYWGLQGVSQRCISRNTIRTPAWVATKYGLGPFLYGPGGYASLVDQGGRCSLGLFLAAGPDVTTFPPQLGYPPVGYPGDGSDWNVPASAFQIISDKRSGVLNDWYASGSPTALDRGIRLNPVVNYYDGGDFRSNGLNGTSPTFPPLPGARWLSPAPDGRNRCVWSDIYAAMGVIDTPLRSGLFALFSGAGGNAWYGNSACASDRGVGEFHFYDWADFGKVALGQMNPWNVQPAAMLDITPILQAHGICTGSHSSEMNGPSGATFDPVSNQLFVRSGGVNGGYDSLLSVWQFKPGGEG